MKTVDLPRITQADADAEPAADRLFTEPPPAPPYPQIVLQTTVLHAGYTFVVTFNDTSLAEAVSVLQKRGCEPAGQPQVKAMNGNGHAPMLSEAPMCPQHAPRKMKPMKHPSRQGHSWMCTFQYDTGDYCVERA
jgi:hypothetical protein